MSVIQHFLLVFDHGRDQLIQTIEFGGDSSAATSRYSELERQYRDNGAIDIVLVGSDSIETVKVTHANYFDGMSKSKVNKVLHDALS